MNISTISLQRIFAFAAPRVNRWTDPLAILLLLAVTAMASARLSATEWVDGLGTILPLALLGSLAGAALGISRFSQPIAGVFALVWLLS